MRKCYDVIVIGGGHAGTEAARAAASALHVGGRAEGRVALITMDPARIGQMSCNPAIGGLGKGQIVREIDALGGLMGRAIDRTGIMFKMLNTSKGPAVRGPRAQADKYAYAAEIQRLIARERAIDVIAATVDDFIVEQNRVVGVVLSAGAHIVRPDADAIMWNESNAGQARPIFPASLAPSHQLHSTHLRAPAVVLTTGTFMRGLMHTGDQRTQGGRVGESAANVISTALQRLGFELGRLKTGTPPRLARESIEWNALEIQTGDDVPIPFSDQTHRQGASTKLSAGGFPLLPQSECRITHTCAAAHELIRANLHRAPMYAGMIDAECGPRYCPSIEDKVVRFAQRDSHHVFLEPESLHTNEIYCNGISTSLPIDVQEQIVRLMPGCANARILKWGYAVEYDMVWPHQIDATCMTKSIHGLFLAGQINCTTGYEEAAGQGLIAGLNAARCALDDDLIRFERDASYLGVMMDDLVTKTPREPYRMFTSRAEHRLHLRADNADVRLTPRGRELGLVGDAQWQAFNLRIGAMEAIRGAFDEVLIDDKPLRDVVRRPELSLNDVMAHLDPESDPRLVERVMTDLRYAGYVDRQRAEVRRQSESEHRRIPEWLDAMRVSGLRSEAAETLARFRPATLGQASRLSGVNPADITLLAIAIRKGEGTGTRH